MRTGNGVGARLGSGAAVLAALLCPVSGGGAAPAKSQQGDCHRVTIEAQLAAGQSLERVFTQAGREQGGGLKLAIQALASGWIVRVVPASGAWGEHDRAELATPPYLSPNPLLLTTDYAFRAQDAIAWNPRHFRYAASAAAGARLLALYPKVLGNDPAAASEMVQISAAQPEGMLRILDATLTPGTADQWRMAAPVATHLDAAPHQVVQGSAASPLGKLVSVRVQVKLDVGDAATPAPELAVEKIPCAPRPTV